MRPPAAPGQQAPQNVSAFYSMLGAFGAEPIAADHDLGQQLAYLQSNFDTSGVPTA